MIVETCRRRLTKPGPAGVCRGDAGMAAQPLGEGLRELRRRLRGLPWPRPVPHWSPCRRAPHRGRRHLDAGDEPSGSRPGNAPLAARRAHARAEVGVQIVGHARHLLCRLGPRLTGNRKVGQPPVLVHRVAVGHAGDVVARRCRRRGRCPPPRPARASRQAAAMDRRAAGGTAPRSAGGPCSVMRLTRQWRYMRANRKSLMTRLASAIARAERHHRLLRAADRLARRAAPAWRAAGASPPPGRSPARRSPGGSSRAAAAAAARPGWRCGPAASASPTTGRWAMSSGPNSRARMPSSRSWL